MPEHKNRVDALLSLVQENRTTSLSCIGMAKNVGKTVAFNHLIQAAAERSLTLGLTSIGRDGERRDEVFLTPKPRIFAPAGSLLATATGTLKRSEAQLEIVQRTGFTSAMGEIIFGRTRTSGLVELAGPQALNNTFFTNFYSTEDKNPISNNFVEAYKKEYGAIPDSMAAMGYDAANLLVDAIRRANSTESAKIRDALSATKNFKSVSGEMSLNETHDAVRGVVIIEMKNGKQVYKETIKP